MSHHHSAGDKQSHFTDLDTELQGGKSVQRPTAVVTLVTTLHTVLGPQGKEGPSETQRLSRGIGASWTGVSLENKKKTIWPWDVHEQRPTWGPK